MANNIDSNTNNFKGVLEEETTPGIQSIKELYDIISANLFKKGYSIEDIHELTLTLILNSRNTGVKLLKKENGTSDFKELTVELIKNSSGANVDFNIIICQ